MNHCWPRQALGGVLVPRPPISVHILIQYTPSPCWNQKISKQAEFKLEHVGVHRYPIGFASKLQIHNLSSHFDIRHTTSSCTNKNKFKTTLALGPCKQASNLKFKHNTAPGEGAGAPNSKKSIKKKMSHTGLDRPLDGSWCWDLPHQCSCFDTKHTIPSLKSKKVQNKPNSSLSMWGCMGTPWALQASFRLTIQA